MLSKEEINRKLLHLFALLMPAGIFYMPKMKWLPSVIVIIILSVLFFGSIIIEILRFKYQALQNIFYRYFGCMLRKEEKSCMTGSTYIIGAAMFCSIFFYNYPHVSFMVLTMFILGDAFAAIVGLSIGHTRVFGKTLEGSMACFFLCVIMLLAIFPHLPLLLDSWNSRVPLPLVFITSICITVFELIPLKIGRKITINDNLAVPVISGAIMIFLYPFFR